MYKFSSGFLMKVSLLKLSATKAVHHCTKTAAKVSKQIDECIKVIFRFGAEWKSWVLNLLQSSPRISRWVLKLFPHKSSLLKNNTLILVKKDTPEESRAGPPLPVTTSPSSIPEESSAPPINAANIAPPISIQISSEETSTKKALQRAWKGSSSGTSESGGYIRTEIAISNWEEYLKKENLWDTRLDGSWQQFKEMAKVRRDLLELSKENPDYEKKATELAQKIQAAIYDISSEKTILLPGGTAKHLIVFELFCTPSKGQDTLNMRLHDKSSYIQVIPRPGYNEQTLQTFDLPTLDFNKDDKISEFINSLVKSWFLSRETFGKIWQEPLLSQLSELASIPDSHWGLPQAAEDCTLASMAAFLRSWYRQNSPEKSQAIEALFK
jgi:hypothetical protein